MRECQRYLPASVLGAGCLRIGSTTQQRESRLAAPLSSLSPVIAGYPGVDLSISQQERQVAGVTSYLLRSCSDGKETAFTIYVGYYDHQLQGKTIHSPKNCLPGAGWEVVSA